MSKASTSSALPASNLHLSMIVPARRWQTLVGRYKIHNTGLTVRVNVLVKNGYLYVAGPIGPLSVVRGEVKLTEHEPGLFFTSEGEAVTFSGDVMLLDSRTFTWER